MKSVLLCVISTALFISGVSSQLTINTPVNVVECQPIQFNWAGGTGPYFVSLHPGADPNGGALIDFGTQTGTSLTWPAVNISANTQLDLTIRDSTGTTAQSAPFTVQSGTTNCLTGSSTPAASTSGTGTGTTTTGTTSTPATTNTGTTTKPTGSTSTSGKPSGASTSSSTSSSSKPSSAAMSNTGVFYGAAGVIGAVVAALLA